MRLVLPLRTWLAVSHTFVLTLPVLAIVGTGTLAWDLQRQTTADIQHQAAVAAEMTAAHLDADRTLGPESAAQISGILQKVRARTLAGYRVVDVSGVVRASSGGGLLDDLSGEPEVHTALQGGEGVTQRPRERAREYTPSGPVRGALVRMWVATPILVDNQVVGAVVVNRTPQEEVQAIYQLAPRLWVGALLALLVTLALGLVAGHLFSRSLVHMARTSHRIADGSIAGTGLMLKPSRSHVRETRELAIAVNDMAARLSERIGYIREFAGNVSHEFKTPLTTLQGTVELLTDDAQMPPEQRQRFLQNAASEVDRMSRLVTGLLALARAEERQHTDDVNVGGVLRAVAGRHARVALQTSECTIAGDAQQLDLAVENLVENAQRYGGDGVTVRIIAEVTATHLHIDVLDDGPGIGEANLPQVTQRFFTTARDDGGTGLGLALVEAVCRAHGGTLAIDSKPGSTRMRMVLPIR